jgi:hypothetical protein
LLGRDKDPENSEVGKLIKQSLEQDRMRADLLQYQQEAAAATAASQSERVAAMMKKAWQDDTTPADELVLSYFDFWIIVA